MFLKVVSKISPLKHQETRAIVGGIVFKPVFFSYNQKEVEKAISITNDSLKSELFRDFLIKHSETGFNMSSQKGDPKSREFKNLKKAFEGINNDRN